MSMVNIDPIDTSLRRITITEDVDLDLDKLLLGDNSGAEAAPADVPSSPLPTNETDLTTNQGAPTSPIFALEEEEEDDEDEKDGGLGHWVLPEPAQPGDHIASTMKKVPSKSILKKTSSYGNFDSLQSSGTSKRRGSGSLGGKKSSFISFNNMLDISSNSIGSSSGRQNRNQVGINDPLDLDSSGGKFKRTKQTSYTSILSLNSAGSGSRGSAIGWDLDDSSSGNITPRSPSRSKFLVDVPPPSMPNLKSSGDDGISDSKHSVTSLSNSGTTSGGKIRRNVSFHSVDVREYDRTIGDNPSCRSGPPLSLDWSYSKKYEQNLEEYEAQRSSERVKSLSKLHVNKYKRRNLLAFHWGHSEDEMKEARGNTKKIQRQRSMTQLMLPISMCEEAVISLKTFVSKRKNKAVDKDDWSDLSNSASTKDTTNRSSPRLPRQDTGLPQRHDTGLPSCHTA